MNISTIILTSVVAFGAPNTNSPTQPYDSLMSVIHEQASAAAFDQYFHDFIDLDSTAVYRGDIPDSIYAARLAALFSPVELAFNDVVKRYIVTYTASRKGTMSVILGRAQYYFPMIESELDRAGLPLELRILPAIESALQPTARSRAGAAGLWQFILVTGRNYGLEITSLVDERLDPVLATKAACKYLASLYKIYDNNWTLALAAYNCGPGNVNKAIARAGGKDKVKSFWDIYPYLPRETRGYVPSFIAATYAFAYHRQHNIVPRDSPLPIAVDTIMISRPLHLKQVEQTLGTPMEVLAGLNPQYTAGVIPARAKSYPLMLPMSDVTRFIAGEEAIHASDSLYLATYLNPNNVSSAIQNAVINETTHKVKAGETLGAIARKYRVTVKQIMNWNHIKNANSLRVGQKLTIYK